MKQQVAELYKNCASKDRRYFNMKWRRGQVFELCESLLPESGLVIDVGCGTGILSNLCNVKQPERQVIGLDLDPVRVGIANQTVGDRKNIEFKVQRLEDMDIETADAIVLVDVIHHLNIDLTHQLFLQIYQMLGTGGIFLLKDIDRKPWHKFAMNYMLDSFNTLRKFTLGSDLIFRDPAIIQKELEDIGFTVERPQLPCTGTCPHALYKCTK